jgi:DNA polymerase elongation subunit (family B)
MLDKLQLEKILFLDIETIPQEFTFEEMKEKSKELFKSKNKGRFLSIRNELKDEPQNELEIWNEVHSQVGGIQSEFGKIICISVGYVHEKYTGKEIRLKSFYHDDEETLLNQFVKLLESNKFILLCGHNAKEFDFPYICRRLLINGIKLPPILDIAGKKPWEISHLDTLELWKFGDYKAYTSLALLCHVFNIPTPKDDISGADVSRVYYVNKELKRIKTYCEKDVVALIQLFLKMRGDNLISESSIYFSED